MFFKNYLIYIFIKFLWAGITWGLVKLPCRLVIHLSKKNVFIVNLISFVFWSAFGIHFIWLCNSYYNYSFCWFGLLGMFLGLFLVKFSLDFLFTKLFVLLYNRITKIKLRKKQDGKLQTNEEN